MRGEGVGDAPGVRGGTVAVDQQHGRRHGQIDDRVPLVVDAHRVGIEAGLDNVLPGDGKTDVEFLLRGGAGGDGVDRHRSARLAVGRPMDRHVALQSRAVVLHGDPHPPLYAGGANVFFRLQGGDRQVPPAGLLDAVDEADLDMLLVEFRKAFLQLVGLVPLAGAEVGEEVDDAALARVLAEQVLEGLEGRQRLGGRLGNVEFLGIVQLFRQAPGEIAGHRLLLEIGPQGAVAAARARQPQERENLRLAGADRRLGEPLDRALALVEGRQRAQVLRHGEAVVQEDHMMGGLGAEKVAPAVGQERLRQGQHHQRDGGHAEQEQQQLLEDDPRAVLFPAGEEELHGRPLHPPVAQHVDQVDQHRSGEEP